MAILEIRKKNAENIWTHTKSGVQIILSKGTFRIGGNYFELTENSGVDQFIEYRTLITDIRLYDETSGGSEETFATPLELATRLKALNYPFFNSASGGSGAVDSVFGRTGDVTAQEGDYSLDQLSDVTIDTPTNNQVLKYNSSTYKFENQNESGGSGDMTKAVYDPNLVEGDAFDMDNMSNPSASKTTPIDADDLTLWDSVAGIFKRLSIANLKTTLTTAFNSLFVRLTTDQTVAGVKTFSDNVILNGNTGFGVAEPTQKADILGNLKVTGSQFLEQGNLNLIHDTNATVAPEISFLGFRQGWRFGIDVANNGGSGDFVLLASDTFGGGVTDLIYMNRNKEGDNSISDNSGFPTLGFFLTPAFTDVQTMFATHESKPNRTTLGIRKAAATTDNFMLGFFGTEDAVVDYGVKHNFEHSPFLKVRGDMEVLSDDINDTSVLRLNANPSDNSQDITMKAYYSGGTGYQFRMFSGNGGNNFYTYSINQDTSTFDHAIKSTSGITAGSGASGTQVLLGGLAGSGYASIHFASAADSPGFGNYAFLADYGGTAGTILNAPSAKNLTFRINNATLGSFVAATNNFNVVNDVEAATFKPYDGASGGYGTVELSDDTFSVSNYTDNIFFQVDYKTGGLQVDNDLNAFNWKIRGESQLTADVALDVPNKSGTIALLDDVNARAKATINVQALTSSPADAATAYFGNLPKAPTTTANISKIYFRETGTINLAEIYCYSGTAGTNEAWSLYVRKNNTTDYLIATVSAATNERVFSNLALNIPIAANDYVEIKMVNPTWVTNPLTCIFGGYLKLV